MIEIGHQSEQISKTIDNINKNVQDITSTVTLTAKSANELATSTKQVTKTFENIIVTSSQNSMHSDNLSGHVSKYTF